MSLRGVSLSEIRRRLHEGKPRVTRAEIVELEADVRVGARALARDAARRRRRRNAETRRLARLFRLEREYRADGVQVIAGVDEVGVGPLAGPVVAAAVVLHERVELRGLDDSKKLGIAARERLDGEIRACARAVSIGVAERDEIDRINIYQAGLLAMQRAVHGLQLPPEIALVDARTIPALAVPQRAVKGGDALCGSIAAASIVAKVYRDARMSELERRYPGYGFARNSGYGTAEHLRALVQRGPTPEHRRSFAPVRSALARPRAQS